MKVCSANLKRRTFSQKRGQTLMLAILIISAAALSIGVAVASLGSVTLISSANFRDQGRATNLAQTCLEDSLLRISQGRIDSSLNFTTSLGQCNIELTGANPYQVISTGQVGRAVKKITASVSVQNEVISISAVEETF